MSKRACITTYNAKRNRSTKARNETFKEDETRNTAKLTWLFNADQVVLMLMIDENVILNQQYSSTQLPNGLEILDSDGDAITNASFESIRSTSNSFRYKGNRYDINNITSHEGGRPVRTARHGITHVIVKDGVTSIAGHAFEEWKDLISVHLPSSVTTIGESAFELCSSLSFIKLSESLQRIDRVAFFFCTSLSEINLPNSVTHIGISAFRGCSSLSSITIPPSSFRRLKSIQLPNTLQSIGQWAFYECTSLESIHILTSISYISHGTFSNCTSLKVIYTPSSALQDGYIFKGCNLANLIILTDTNHFEYEGIPSITLHNVLQCIDHLPNDMDIPPHQQLHTLHHSLQQRFPRIAERTEQSSLNLLHLLVYFPGVSQGDDDDDMYQSLLTLLTKYPQAMTAVDSSGKTPLHHAMTSTRHIMNSNCYDLLLDRCPDRVVHLAIRSVVQSLVLQSSPWRWDDVCDMVYAKMNALSMEDVESGLLPFMMVAEASNDVEGLSMVYELLCLNPGVLKEYM